MTTFDERKDQFEKKFVHDAELRFKAESRRNRLLGRWAATLLELDGVKADEYVASVIRADLKHAGAEDVFAKIRGDFDAAGVEQTDHQIRRHMEEFMAEAIRQLRDEG